MIQMQMFLIRANNDDHQRIVVITSQRYLFFIYYFYHSQLYKAFLFFLSLSLRFLLGLMRLLVSQFLWPTVKFLIDGLVDFQPHSSSGACVVLNSCKLLGSALKDQVHTCRYIHCALKNDQLPTIMMPRGQCMSCYIPTFLYCPGYEAMQRVPQHMYTGKVTHSVSYG